MSKDKVDNIEAKELPDVVRNVMQVGFNIAMRVESDETF